MSSEILQGVNVSGLMLLRYNASSHTARLTVEFLKQKQIKVIEHLPYSTYLAILKKNSCGHVFIQKK
ncbi:UNVERIFIED_CONTAM: hypothetical protein NCL1_17026 [Trichonephila clavipes]